MRVFAALILLLCWPVLADAQDRAFRLASPEVLTDSGLLDYVLPRFSLKTGIRVHIVGEGEEHELALNSRGVGRRAFSGPNHDWHLATAGEAASGPSAKFAEWIFSDIGKRTIDSFAIDGSQVYSAALHSADENVTPVFDGDIIAGERLALAHCGRCHVVNAENRMKAIGSTPSFALLRSLPDWDQRFQIFYTLNPHPAFTQIEKVTEPFSVRRPPPIFPLILNLGDINAILAFVATLRPADLGAPLRHQ